MSKDDARAVAEDLTEGDRITIGQFDVVLTVSNNTAGQIIEAKCENHPEKGEVMAVTIDTQTEGDNMMVDIHELDDSSDYIGTMGEIIRKGDTYELRELSIVD